MLESAILLVRISDPKQDKGYSRAAQRQYGLDYCAKNSMELVADPFDFIETASKPGARSRNKRPILSRMGHVLAKSDALPPPRRPEGTARAIRTRSRSGGGDRRGSAGHNLRRNYQANTSGL